MSITAGTPFQLRDFSKGRITKYSVNAFLAPQNSVSNSINVNFETIIGSAVVRPGTTLLGSTVASTYSPLGLAEFVGPGGTPNLLFSVFKGATNASLYYYDTSWHTTTVTLLDNAARCRFATIGGRVFMVNGKAGNVNTAYNYDYLGMMSSLDGIVWDTTNCVDVLTTSVSDISGVSSMLGVVPTLIMRAKQRLILGGNQSIASGSLQPDRIFFSSIIQPNVTLQNTTLTRASTTVTATCTAHGYSVNDYVTISGAAQAEYNGTYRVATTADANTFTYNITGSPATPATGTIKSSKPQITFNTNSLTGDWIDINPDDNGNLTAFAEAADQVIVFKDTGMYRLDLVNKSVDSSNIFNVGAVSQEAVTACNGIVYFYSGMDIRRTNGGFPEQISRLAVQDFIDAIPVASKINVTAGSDGQNVTFSIGDITLNANKNSQRTYTNVVLKFSTRDESWSAHSYAQRPFFFTQFSTTTDGRKMVFADTIGNVQTFDKGTTDNGSDIFFELETQEIDDQNRAHLHKIANQVSIFANNGIDSKFQVKEDDGDFKDIKVGLSERVNIGEDIQIDANYMTFRWSGNSKGTAPVFEGFYIEDITDMGQTKS